MGPHLRVHGSISLLRFNRLSDLLNYNRGYLHVTEVTARSLADRRVISHFALVS